MPLLLPFLVAATPVAVPARPFSAPPGAYTAPFSAPAGAFSGGSQAPLLSPLARPLPASEPAPGSPNPGFVNPGSLNPGSLNPGGGMNALISVEPFDPEGRAALIARVIPRQWRGSFQSFMGGPALPAALDLGAVRAMGQMVDLRGNLRIGNAVTPVQGTLNAKSDQLDLLILGDMGSVGMEPGGQIQGLQSMSLSSWRAPRLVSPGGRLLLNPGPSLTGPEPIRGLW
jgi:hypothetical protein